MKPSGVEFIFLASLCFLEWTNHLTAARLSDATGIPVLMITSEAHSNVTLPCPGVTERSLITTLQWASHTKLVEYMSETTTVWEHRHRINLLSDNFALHFHPVIAEDSGEYSCLVNNRPKPEAIVKLVVQGGVDPATHPKCSYMRMAVNRRIWKGMTCSQPESISSNVFLHNGKTKLFSSQSLGDKAGAPVRKRNVLESSKDTVGEDVPDPPGRPLIMGFTSRSANLSWAPPQNTHNSPVKFYSIHVRVGEDGHWDVKNAIITSNNETSYQVVGLYPFTVYSFRVVATNSMGPSHPSKESYYMVTLREVPDGKPTVTMAYNTSSTSIHVSWRAPHKSTIHGEFLGYRISYRPREKGDDEVKEIYIRDSNVDSHTIQNLETYTQYLVSVQVFNPEGPGPNATVLVMTDEGEPSKPLNLTVIRATSTTIELSWAKPEHENGDVKGYRIYFMHGNYTDVRTTSTPVLSHTLDTLRPYTEYKIWVKAYTWKNEGLQSDSVRYRTDVGGPSAPTITNLTCQSNNTLYVEWRRPRPADYYISIDQYFVLYRSYDSNEFEEKSVGALDSLDNSTGLFQTLLTNLTTDSIYEVQVQAGTKSIYYEKELIRGSLSGTRTILVKTDCDKYSPLLSQVSSELSAGMIAGLICVIVAILIALSVLIIWKKCFKASYYYLDDPTAMSVPTACDWDQHKENGVSTAIPIHLFAKHVASLHADGDIGFSKEYETIQNSSTEGHTVINSQLPDNKNKNRYLNILAYDHTRVHLLPLPGQKKSTEYLNANYIDGFQKSRAYIGTQGPLPATFNCFWRMVWEQRVGIIVMITNLIERGRRKCDMYWPKEGTEVYGVISVSLVKEDIRATYTIRTFQIRHLRIKKKKSNIQERTVLQYHYTNWPDHGTPDHPLPILRFVSKSSAANPPDAGPIIVHCSAGVGRTGAYIVLDAMLKQIKAKGEINIYGFLRHIRTQRNFLVQTEEQYIFIHDALVEAIESGETNIHQGYLSRYLSTMVANPQCDKSLPGIVLDNQYKLVTSFRAEDYNTISARKSVNIGKNRNNEIVPMECFRVHLTPKPGVDGSDYINATWFIGYHKMREFIITQTPLENTVLDFWQMVWDHSAQTVVLLTSTEVQELNAFWPTEQNLLEGENYKVKLVVESEQGGCTMMDFTLQSAQDDYDLPVRIFNCPSWPHSCSPLHKVFDLIKRVQEWNKETQHGPVIVVDRFGGTEAATFCLLTSVFKQLTHENHVDIYMYAKLYHLRRLGIWPAVNDYLYLYEAIEALANSSGFTSAGAVTPTPVGLGPTPDIYISSNGHINGYIRFDSDNMNEVTSTHNENGFPCGATAFEEGDDGVRNLQGNGTVPNMNNMSVDQNLSSTQ